LENENAGNNATIISSPTTKVNRTFSPINYHKKTIKDEYNQLTLNCKGNYGIIFRAYNDAVAYRFFTKMNGEIIIRSEEANFNFPDDEEAFYPISTLHSKPYTEKRSFRLFQKIRSHFFPCLLKLTSKQK
jgi:hypothetical protein